MFVTALASLVLLIEPTQAYDLELTVVQDGVETITSRSQVVIDEPAFATVPHASGLFELQVSLNTIQGDGESELLQLDLSASRNGEALLEPTVTLVRGQPFRFQSGQPDAEMVRISLTPFEAD